MFQHLQKTAELAVKEYDYDYRLTLDEVDYLNMNDPQNSSSFEPNAKFGQDIHTSSSGVHIPIEIYEGCE